MFGLAPVADEGLINYWFGGQSPAGFAYAVRNVPYFSGADMPNYYVPDSEIATPVTTPQIPAQSVTDVSGALTNTDFVGALYRAYYHRQADPPGLQFWVNQITSGRSRASVEDAFRTSPDQSPDSTKTLPQYLAQFSITLPAAAVTPTTAAHPATTAAQPAAAAQNNMPLLLIALGLGALFLFGSKK